ncbi:MAG: hypothetical protein K8S23_03400 [Candidatus Cloacimonetes bacterium]|nr:hypothetical protein [Candidatus Cloacimonadota bacterium]
MKIKMSFWIMIIVAMNVCGNSIFSFDGMPLTYYGDDIYGQGMGDTSLSDLFRINTNYHNPANAVTANKVIFSTATTLGYQWYMDENNGYRDNGLFFPYFSLNVPIRNHKFAFSYNSYMAGNLQNEQNLFWTADDGTEYNYTEENKISSNIYKINLLYALKNKYVNIGISADYYFGHEIIFKEMDFDSYGMNDTKYEIEKTFKSAGYTIGLSKRYKNISLGFSYKSKAELTGDEIYRYNFTPGTDTIQDGNNLLEIPATYSTGITIKLLEKLKFSIANHYELWEDTSYDESLENSYKVGFGIAYEPLSGFGNWYEKIPVRMGSYYRTLPFKKNNETIGEKGITFGLSIPFKAPGKRLDLALVYSLRGEVSKHGIRDKNLQLSLGISGFDIFSKRLKKIGHRDIPKADY